MIKRLTTHISSAVLGALALAGGQSIFPSLVKPKARRKPAANESEIAEWNRKVQERRDAKRSRK